MKKEKNFWIENCKNDIDVIANKVESYGIQRFKISILNTEFDCKKIQLSNADDRYHYSYIFSDGSEKISRSREECEYCIGTENLKFAEKQVLKNMKILSQKLKVNLESDLMKSISGIVNQFVKYYRSDWYHWDNYFIRKHNISKFILCLRESGTHLLPLISDIDYTESNKSIIDYMLKNRWDNYKYFLCDMRLESIEEITLSDIEKYL